MTKKMKRDRTPTPVDDSVAEAMEVRLAYKNLIDSFNEDQKVLEQRIGEIAPQAHGSEENPGAETGNSDSSDNNHNSGHSDNSDNSDSGNSTP